MNRIYINCKRACYYLFIEEYRVSFLYGLYLKDAKNFEVYLISKK
jgi:hypothetical protein